jgi:NDP-sugar pyrophosphorylase family protein
MKYAIIAAGEGSRLASEGISTPKPLVEIAGESLIDRQIRIFMNNRAEEIICICNDRTAQVASHLAQLQRDGLRGRPVPLRFLVKNTPSSMHSFFEISKFLTDDPFVLTTVDTIFRENEFSDFVNAWRASHSDALMGVTRFVDDEKPLYVRTDPDMDITAFKDDAAGCQFVSGGIYALGPTAIYTLSNCIARSESHMRNFQRAMLADKRKVKAWEFSKVFDIDHTSDIAKAEQWLAGQ